MEPPQLPKGPYGTQRKGRRPTSKAKCAPMTETVSKDTVQEGRQCDGNDQRDQRKERLRARTGQNQRASAKPTTEADKATTKKERGMERERLRQGLQLRNKREKGDRPLKGKDQAERKELSPTRSRREDHSKRTGSHRSPREPSGRGQSLTRRKRLQAQKKTTCRQEAEQSRWTWKWTYGQGSTMERTKNPQRPVASVRTNR